MSRIETRIKTVMFKNRFTNMESVAGTLGSRARKTKGRQQVTRTAEELLRKTKVVRTETKIPLATCK